MNARQPARPVLGLRPRLMVLVAAGVLVPTALAAWAGLTSIHALTGELLRERESLAVEMQVRAEDAVDEAIEQLSGIGMAARTSDAELQEAARLTYMHSRLFAAVALLGPDGSAIAQEPEAYPLEQARPALLAPAAAARRLGRPTASPALRVNGALVHALLVPLRDRTGAMSRVAVGIRGLDERRWNGVLHARRLDGAHVDLVDADGVVIASSDRAHLGVMSPRLMTVAAPHDRDPRILHAVDADGSATIVAATPLAVLPWTVAIAQPARLLLAPVTALRMRLLLLVPLALCVGLLFAWGAAASVRQPLAILTRAAERVAGGDIHDPMPPLPGDEIGRLGRALETMRTHLATLVARVQANNAQLEARVVERTQALAAAHRELQERDAQRSRLFGRVLTAQEEERRRLARELHDETCQKIAAIGLRLDMAARADSLPSAHAGIGEARSLVARTLDDVHRVIFDLRPSVLDDLGLLAAIRWLAARQLESAGIRVRHDFPDVLPALAPNVETALFRAVQEAISNIARHAHAEHVLIEISALPAAPQSEAAEEGSPGTGQTTVPESGRLHVEIEDDGCGFEVERMTRPSDSGQGLGLLGLHERMELVGGQAMIDSTPADGTRVMLDVPVAAGRLEGACRPSAS